MATHNWGVGALNYYDVTRPEELQAIARRAPGRIIMRFYRVGCPACDRMAGTWADMSRRQDYKGVTFVSVNVEESPVLSKHYKVERIPTFVSIDKVGGTYRPSNSFTGANVESLRRLIETGSP